MLNGFDELNKKLKELQNNAKKLDCNHQIPYSELFPNEFMEKYTQFSSIQEMFDESPFEIKSIEDFNSLSETELDEYINTKTIFSTWTEMNENGFAKWTAKKLGF